MFTVGFKMKGFGLEPSCGQPPILLQYWYEGIKPLFNEKMEYEKNVTRVAFKKVIIKCSSATVLMKWQIITVNSHAYFSK